MTTTSTLKPPPHLDWLVDTGKKLKTACGTDVDVLELRHVNDSGILSAWAAHFRNQYCAEDMIDALRGTKSRKEYLEEIKFPSKTDAPGPSIRAGDFSEILLADYLEWRLGFWVPRVRWDGKVIRNESAKGCDVIGFHLSQNKGASPNDILAVIESKASLSGINKDLLQTSVTDSAKDDIRKAESLNYIKQRFLWANKINEANVIERFQSPVDQPYKEFCAAAAVFSTNSYDETSIQATNATSIKARKKKATKHPHHGSLKMIVVKGDDLMPLVHHLYQRAADEA